MVEPAPTRVLRSLRMTCLLSLVPCVALIRSPRLPATHRR